MSSKHHSASAHDHRDHAPGDETGSHTGIGEGIRGYLIGLVLATGLTIASFGIAGTGLLYGPGVPVALLVFAVAQMGVHLVFFLHITTGPDNTNNVLALAFGVLIVMLVVIGSVWIMATMNHNMMPEGMAMPGGTVMPSGLVPPVPTQR
jgi:cytochrome o ubiquinol oxidase operon protein cyoD